MGRRDLVKSLGGFSPKTYALNPSKPYALLKQLLNFLEFPRRPKPQVLGPTSCGKSGRKS